MSTETPSPKPWHWFFALQRVTDGKWYCRGSSYNAKWSSNVHKAKLYRSRKEATTLARHLLSAGGPGLACDVLNLRFVFYPKDPAEHLTYLADVDPDNAELYAVLRDLVLRRS